MDLGDAVLFGAVVVLGFNHLLRQVPGWHQRMVPFWFLQLANLGAAVFFAGWGLPGLQGPARYVSW
ncbi:MAG: hypothetical protein QGG40_20545, partial [Myxococcota bacterium]|nr:hypothetical protein [Myxococcota bacterium]